MKTRKKRIRSLWGGKPSVSEVSTSSPDTITALHDILGEALTALAAEEDVVPPATRSMRCDILKNQRLNLIKEYDTDMDKLNRNFQQRLRKIDADILKACKPSPPQSKNTRRRRAFHRMKIMQSR